MCPHLVLNTSLLSGVTRCSRLILYFSCPNPGVNHFSSDCWGFFLMVSRRQDLGARLPFWNFMYPSICLFFPHLLSMDSEGFFICCHIQVLFFLYIHPSPYDKPVLFSFGLSLTNSVFSPFFSPLIPILGFIF